jgi:hypothetical protein
MSATQFFPIPPALFALACDTVSKRVSRLPFLRSGVMITGELIGVTMECLNAEPKKALPLNTPRDPAGGFEDGLDRCIEGRLTLQGKIVVPVLSEVLCSAGIAEPVQVTDRHTPRSRNGMRLLPPWTWHIGATTAPVVRFGEAGENGTVAMSWMSMCPICRTGILDLVVGKQLFGIPHTDFYIECSHCGAKFIPVGPAFRLVSIATIRDPLWKKHLDKTYPPDTWAALARGTGSGSPVSNPPAVKKPSVPSLPVSAVTLSRLKDGSLAVPFEGKTLYFRPVSLHFAGGVKEDTFAREQKILGDLLKTPEFQHLQSPVNAKYSRYLPLKTGLFLGQLKERHDPFYREFLHQYGDERYGSFRAEESGETGKKGVLIVVANRGLYEVVSCPDTFRTMINDTFGRVGPADCLLSGDPVRCRVNAILSTNKKEAGLYIHTAETGDERARITNALKGLISP